MISFLIVSKDRPCQLDLSLRSYLDNFLLPYKATVLYTYSNAFYKKGYDIILDLYGNKFNFVKENHFKTDVLKSLDPTDKYFTSLGDDCLLTNPLTLTGDFEIFDQNKNILALRYLMGPEIEVVFEGDFPQALPNFITGRVWNWQTCSSLDWRYPHAMMGQFYRMEDMINYLPQLSFYNPTSFETCMIGRPFKHKPLMSCFSESKVIELAVNRVQNTAVNNRSGAIDINFLNNKWLDGQRIKIEPLYGLPTSLNRYFNINFEYEYRK